MTREQRLLADMTAMANAKLDHAQADLIQFAIDSVGRYHAASDEGPGDASAYDKPHPAPDEYWYPNSAVWEMLRDKNAARAHTPKAAESGEFPEAEFPMDSFTSWLGGQTFDDQMEAEIAIAQWAWRKALASRPKAEGVTAEVKHFKFWGTDGCKSCDTGRITLFVANEKCTVCDPESYRVKPKAEGREFEAKLRFQDGNGTQYVALSFHFSDYPKVFDMVGKRVTVREVLERGE